MSNKNRRDNNKEENDAPEVVESTPHQESRHTHQNVPPQVQWQTFEQCWHACVKHGTPLLMESCKAHLRAMGWLNKPEKWIDGMRHFGIPLEK